MGYICNKVLIVDDFVNTGPSIQDPIRNNVKVSPLIFHPDIKYSLEECLERIYSLYLATLPEYKELILLLTKWIRYTIKCLQPILNVEETKLLSFIFRFADEIFHEHRILETTLEAFDLEPVHNGVVMDPLHTVKLDNPQEKKIAKLITKFLEICHDDDLFTPSELGDTYQIRVRNIYKLIRVMKVQVLTLNSTIEHFLLMQSNRDEETKWKLYVKRVVETIFKIGLQNSLQFLHLGGFQ